MNLYAYCAGNPIRYVDPSGHSFVDKVKGFFSGIAESLTFGGSNALENKDSLDSESGYYNGKVAGNLTAGVLSEGGTFGGATISTTEVSAIAGVPAIAYSKSVQVYSAGAAIKNSIIAMSANGGNDNDWDKGSFDSSEDSIDYHHKKHGKEVGAKNSEQYLRKAESFKNNLKGARKIRNIRGNTPGVTLYIKNGKYIDITSDGKIISFGTR